MKKLLITLSLIGSIGLAAQAFAHEGEDHAAAPGTDASVGVVSTITLSDTAINNLGIQTIKAEIAPRAASVDVNGLVEFLPERQAIITSRAVGRVSEIHVKVGENVTKGQRLLTIQPIFVGSSPVTIPSPLTGFVTKQSVVLGQSVTPEAALMELGDPSEILVRGVMYETPEVGKIQVGQKVRVSSSLISGKPLVGTVQRMDGAYDRGSRTFNVYALVENPERRLLANMQVVLSIEITTPADILTVPVKAILGDSGEQFVFVRSENDFERRSVKLGTKFGTDREVLEGVFPDEEVVTVGNYQLQFAKSAEPKKDEHKDEHKE
jgi:cobalt-zinc-cadmium efflux system membrane fusion protein